MYRKHCSALVRRQASRAWLSGLACPHGGVDYLERNICVTTPKDGAPWQQLRKVMISRMYIAD